MSTKNLQMPAIAPAFAGSFSSGYRTISRRPINRRWAR